MHNPKSKQVRNKKPTVTIVIPCHNAELFLKEVMDSVERQTSRDFQVICIDDGSKDRTHVLLEEWAGKSQIDIQIIKQNNCGVSRARNEGIVKARGEYILFLDSDDIIHEAFVEKMIVGIKKADIAYCRLSRNLDDVVDCDIEKADFRFQDIKTAMHKLLYEMGKYGFYCYIYKKELIDRIGLRFDENTKFGEDREFIWKYITHCKSAAWLDLPLYGYRLNPQSITRRSASWRKTDSLKAVKRTEQYLGNNKCVFLKDYESYMFARVMWSAAKMFSVNKNKKLFERLQKEYDVRSCMKITTKDPNILVRIASRAYLVSPMLFYGLVGLKNDVDNLRGVH